MKRVAVDLDGTIFKTYEKMMNCFEKYFRKEFDEKKILFFEKLNFVEKIWVFHYFTSLIAYQNLEVYENAIDTIIKLKKEHELFFTTIRPRRTEIIQFTFNILNQIIETDSNHVLFFKNQKEKLKFFSQKIDIVIEDNPLGIYEILNSTCAIILKRKWNEELLWSFSNPHLLVVEDWKEVSILLKNL